MSQLDVLIAKYQRTLAVIAAMEKYGASDEEKKQQMEFLRQDQKAIQDFKL